MAVYTGELTVLDIGRDYAAREIQRIFVLVHNDLDGTGSLNLGFIGNLLAK